MITVLTKTSHQSKHYNLISIITMYLKVLEKIIPLLRFILKQSNNQGCYKKLRKKIGISMLVECVCIMYLL